MINLLRFNRELVLTHVPCRPRVGWTWMSIRESPWPAAALQANPRGGCWARQSCANPHAPAKAEKLLEAALGGQGEVGFVSKKTHKPPNHIELLPKKYAERLRLWINCWTYSCLSSLPFYFFYSFFLSLPFHSLISLWFSFFFCFFVFLPFLCYFQSFPSVLFLFYLFPLLQCSLQERRGGHCCDLALIPHWA